MLSVAWIVTAALDAEAVIWNSPFVLELIAATRAEASVAAVVVFATILVVQVVRWLRTVPFLIRTTVYSLPTTGVLKVNTALNFLPAFGRVFVISRVSISTSGITKAGLLLPRPRAIPKFLVAAAESGLD